MTKGPGDEVVFGNGQEGTGCKHEKNSQEILNIQNLIILGNFLHWSIAYSSSL